MVEEKRSVMKYIRTYETEEKFLTDKDSTSRGFRLKPTLYKYSKAGDHVHLELDDPRKHGDSTYMEITLDSDVEFSFYIGNAPDDTQTTMNCTIDWGDGTVETKTITLSEMEFTGFKLSHNYKAGSYKIELYDVERNYSTVGGYESWGEYTSPISHPSSIKRVVLGSNFIIGHKAFGGCTSLASVHIPEGVTSIGESAFYRCDSLASVYIPESVTSIEGGAFSSCISLTSINIPERVTSIGYSMFTNCSSLTSVHIPEGVTIIESNAFFSCTSLKSIYIPESVTSIEYWAFEGCSSLTSVYIPESVTSIGQAAFADCSSLTSINIPESVTSIEAQVFSDCSSLTSINIPERVTSIGAGSFGNTFGGCSSLKSISSLNTTAPTLGNDVFTNLPTNGTLHIKSGATGYDAWLSKLPSGWTIVEDL